MADWDPELYNRFRRYRAEPVEHIFKYLDLTDNGRIADLGCGPGENTVALARRFAECLVTGIDSSAAMIESAQKIRADLDEALRRRIDFRVGDIAKFSGSHDHSLIFSNAAFHWLRGHWEIFSACLNAMRAGGQIVVQMPANENETGKTVLNELADREPWREPLHQINHSIREVAGPAYYTKMLSEIGYIEVDCYYETFHHPLGHAADVAVWYKSTALRPYLDALAPQRQAEFLDQYSSALERAYGTAGAIVFPFRRLFIWGRRPAH
jgi:trans-aconitate 2-methyltransferase